MEFTGENSITDTWDHRTSQNYTVKQEKILLLLRSVKRLARTAPTPTSNPSLKSVTIHFYIVIILLEQ